MSEEDNQQDDQRRGLRLGNKLIPPLIIYLVGIPVAVLIILLLLSIFMCGSPDDNPEELKQTERDAYMSSLELTDIQINSTLAGGISISGEIKNNGVKTVRKIEIMVYYLDESGRTAFERTYYPVLTSRWETDENKLLKPNSSQQFQYRLDDFPVGWSGEVGVKIAKIAFIYEAW